MTGIQNMKSRTAIIVALIALSTAARTQAQAPAADAAGLHRSALNLMKENNGKEAVAQLEKAVALAPDNADFQSDYGRAIGMIINDAPFMQKIALTGKVNPPPTESRGLQWRHSSGGCG